VAGCCGRRLLGLTRDIGTKEICVLNVRWPLNAAIELERLERFERTAAMLRFVVKMSRGRRVSCRPRAEENQKLTRALTCMVRLGTVTLLIVEEPVTIAPLTAVS
jgi:hypothetical protein